MNFASTDPATGETLAEFPLWDAGRVEAALDAAAGASRRWADTPLSARVAALDRVAGLLRERRTHLAATMTLEMGKLEAEALAEIDKCALACEHYARYAATMLADEPVNRDGRHARIVWQPLGPVLAIMPWNFPFWQVIRFSAPALAAGNTVLLKHAPNVPQCALALAQLFDEAGVPEGAFQSLFIDTDQAADIIADGRVRAVTLTGSERAGRAVAAVAGRHLKKCVLELGGSDPFVVLDDAPLDSTLDAAVKARFQNAGQSCIAAKRFIVEAGIHDEFAAGFSERAAALECGKTLAPLARIDLREQLHEQVTRSIAAGARALTGCEPFPGPGAYYRPSVLDKVAPGMAVADEETFGPVAAVIRVEDEDAAVAAANATRYGLGASVWTADAARGACIARRFESGLAFVNDIVKSDPGMPFGGVKSSGYGRELGVLGLREFVNAKTLWIA